MGKYDYVEELDQLIEKLCTNGSNNLIAGNLSKTKPRDIPKEEYLGRELDKLGLCKMEIKKDSFYPDWFVLILKEEGRQLYKEKRSVKELYEELDKIEAKKQEKEDWEIRSAKANVFHIKKQWVYLFITAGLALVVALVVELLKTCE